MYICCTLTHWQRQSYCRWEIFQKQTNYKHPLTMEKTNKPASHSHRTRGYLCSFPITSTPPPPQGRIQIMDTDVSGKGNIHYLWYWLPLAITNTPPFRDLSGNLPETKAKKYSPFPRKLQYTHAASSCTRVGGGGGVNKPHDQFQTNVITMHKKHVLTNFFFRGRSDELKDHGWYSRRGN